MPHLKHVYIASGPGAAVGVDVLEFHSPFAPRTRNTMALLPCPLVVPGLCPLGHEAAPRRCGAASWLLATPRHSSAPLLWSQESSCQLSLPASPTQTAESGGGNRAWARCRHGVQQLRGWAEGSVMLYGQAHRPSQEGFGSGCPCCAICVLAAPCPPCHHGLVCWHV